MFYITGDTHATFHRIKYFCNKMQTTTDDTMIILGDVGLNFFGTHSEKKQKESLSRCNITLFCIQGNHEERPYNFPDYKTKEWNGGIVYYEERFPNILFAKDGEIYDFDGKKCLVIGGAYSVDKWFRIYKALLRTNIFEVDKISEKEIEKIQDFIHLNAPDPNNEVKNLLLRSYEKFPHGICYWFKEEQPSDEIKKYVEKQIENKNIDIVFSHTCPFKYIPTEAFLPFINQDCVDNSTEKWLDKIEENINYEKWYCGHWHINKQIDKMCFVFEDYHML